MAFSFIQSLSSSCFRPPACSISPSPSLSLSQSFIDAPIMKSSRSIFHSGPSSDFTSPWIFAGRRRGNRGRWMRKAVKNGSSSCNQNNTSHTLAIHSGRSAEGQIFMQTVHRNMQDNRKSLDAKKQTCINQQVKEIWKQNKYSSWLKQSTLGMASFIKIFLGNQNGFMISFINPQVLLH